MEPHRRDTANSARLHPAYYRKLYRAVLRVVLVNSFVLAGLCALTVYLGFYGFKHEYYFTTTPSSRIMPLKYQTEKTIGQTFSKPAESSSVSSVNHGQSIAP